MDKQTRLSGQSNAEPITPSYRIICNSEHFIVINPSRKPQKKVEGERMKEVGPRKKIIQN